MKVYILEDHPMVSNGIQMILKSEFPHAEFILSETLDDGMKKIPFSSYDLAIVDLNLKGERTFQWLEKSILKNPQAKHLIFTSSVRRDYFEKAFHLGVNGYLVKESQPEDLLYAVRTILNNRTFKDPIFDELESHAQPATDQLTKREKEVLKLLAEGKTNQEIAEMLFVSIYTVKKYVTAIMSKMNFSNRTEAAIYAQTHYI